MVSKYFDIRELVPQSVFKAYGDDSIWFIDPRLVKVLDAIRGHFKAPVTINNWHTGGTYQNRGYRLPNTTVGASLSQHKFGRAADINIKGYTPQSIYKEILANETLFLCLGLTTLEDIEMTPTWNHLDVRNTGLDRILIVKPLLIKEVEELC